MISKCVTYFSDLKNRKINLSTTIHCSLFTRTMISEKIKQITNKNFDHFNTPGHKGTLLPNDISEISNGHHFPSDLVKKAERKASKVFGCKEVRFLTNGASQGIKAALLAVDGDVIVQTNSHTSVFEGARLARKKVFKCEELKAKCGVWNVKCEVNEKINLSTTSNFKCKTPNLIKNTFPLSYHNHHSPTLFALKTALKNHSSAEAVVLTTPDYFGRTISKELINVVKDSGKVLILDSAHGAHYPFRPDLFPETHIKHADFVILSAHKTLNAFTQTAYLCVNNESLIHKTDEALRLLGTTSPFYPFLAGLENAVHYHTENAKKYDELKRLCDNFRREIKTLHSDDFSRLVIPTANGEELCSKLLENGIIAEAYCEDSIILITTIFDDEKKFNKLKEKLKILC